MDPGYQTPTKTKNMKNLELFRRRADTHISGLRDLATRMVQSTGNKEEDCQQLTILNRISALERAINGTEEYDLIAHTIFCEPIACPDDARRLLSYLHQHGLTFHPDDDPADLSPSIFSEEEAIHLRSRMDEIATIQDFDPCAFLIEITNQDKI